MIAIVVVEAKLWAHLGELDDRHVAVYLANDCVEADVKIEDIRKKLQALESAASIFCVEVFQPEGLTRIIEATVGRLVIVNPKDPATMGE